MRGRDDLAVAAAESSIIVLPSAIIASAVALSKKAPMGLVGLAKPGSSASTRQARRPS